MATAKPQDKPKAVCSKCEELKPIMAKGLCSKCYQQERRANTFSSSVSSLMTELDQATDLDEVAKAREILKRSLPEIAASVVVAAKVAAISGNSKPAETILRELPLSDDPNERIFRSQFGSPNHGSVKGQENTGVQVLIGIQLGGTKQIPATSVTAQAIPVAASTQAAAGQVVDGQIVGNLEPLSPGRPTSEADGQAKAGHQPIPAADVSAQVIEAEVVKS
jgi:hypothetical protein